MARKANSLQRVYGELVGRFVEVTEGIRLLDFFYDLEIPSQTLLRYLRIYKTVKLCEMYPHKAKEQYVRYSSELAKQCLEDLIRVEQDFLSDPHTREELEERVSDLGPDYLVEVARAFDALDLVLDQPGQPMEVIAEKYQELLTALWHAENLAEGHKLGLLTV